MGGYLGIYNQLVHKDIQVGGVQTDIAKLTDTDAKISDLANGLEQLEQRDKDTLRECIKITTKLIGDEKLKESKIVQQLNKITKALLLLDDKDLVKESKQFQESYFLTLLHSLADDIPINEEVKKKLIDQLATFSFMPDIEDDIVKVIMDIREHSPEKLGDVIRMLSLLRDADDIPKDLAWVISNVSDQLLFIYQEEAQKLGPSTASREHHRTPTEVLTHFLAEVDVKDYKEEAKQMMLTHKLSVTDTKAFLNRVQSNCQSEKIQKLCNELILQLPRGEHAEKTRLHDNIYGRAFETAVIASLVEHPPEGVVRAMNQASLSFADYLKTFSEEEIKEIALKLQGYLKEGDPRFWFPKVSEVEAIRDAETEDEVYETLMHYLKMEKITGVECLSLPYFMTKIAITLRDQTREQVLFDLLYESSSWKKEELEKRLYEESHKRLKTRLPWMYEATRLYSIEIIPQTARLEGIHVGKLETEGAGITLSYQPSIAKEEWMEPSQRPTTAYKPDLEPGLPLFEKALNLGVPWGSGVSGSANIALYILKEFDNPKIDPKEFLLGVMMFLVYDGGHSMHEAIWTAAFLDKELDFGFGLSESEDPEAFIADYQKFKEIYLGSSTKEALEEAFEKGFEQLTDYYHKIRKA